MWAILVVLQSLAAFVFSNEVGSAVVGCCSVGGGEGRKWGRCINSGSYIYHKLKSAAFFNQSSIKNL